MTETAPAAGQSTEQSTAEPEIHHTHRDLNSGWLRPAVFGAMDGVVSNGALITGVAAAHVGPHDVILSGWAGLLSGAFSMAVGEWTSVRSQAELVESEIAKERAEIARAPKAEQAELVAILRHRGLSRELAVRVAEELGEEPEELWRTHVREELGVDPDEQPSPYLAGLLSLVTFAIGAVVPLAPYLLGTHTLWWSLLLGGVTLFGVGAAVARLTARPMLMGAMRQLALGGVTVAVVFGVGRAIGAGVSG